MQRFVGYLPLVIFLTLLVWSAPRLSQLMTERPAVVKLGYTPPPLALKMTCADHRYTIAEMIALKVLVYFGSLVEEWKNQVIMPPEYFNMFRTLETSIRLDPYNADVYYFAQAVFTWDVGRAQDVNRFLEHGMKYRTWDPMLPFFAGFNAAYFLQDYETAARYMQRASEISNNPAMARLASRYFYESGRTELAITFLDDMIHAAPSRQEADIYRLRRDALMAIKILQDAMILYEKRFGGHPTELRKLIDAGVLESLPADPYGGRFYLDEQKRVRSTSNLAAPPEPPETGP